MILLHVNAPMMLFVVPAGRRSCCFLPTHQASPPEGVPHRRLASKEVAHAISSVSARQPPSYRTSNSPKMGRQPPLYHEIVGSDFPRPRMPSDTFLPEPPTLTQNATPRLVSSCARGDSTSSGRPGGGYRPITMSIYSGYGRPIQSHFEGKITRYWWNIGWAGRAKRSSEPAAISVRRGEGSPC
jgi:hypothetical protein